MLDYWLMLVICAFASEELLFGFFSTTRFSLGFYAGRAFTLATSMLILGLLLAETTQLYARIARSNMILENERENKLMNMQAAAASISHEIKQPLTAISANCEAALCLLEMELPDIVEARAALKDVKESAHSAGETLDGIRALFGRADQRQQQVDLNEVALEVLQTLRGEFSVYGIKAITELTSTVPLVNGNRGQLKEVVNNLIHNAVEAMAATTGRSRRLCVRTERHGADAIAVAVQDSGPGLDPKKIDELFDPFVTTKPHGMGLGLAICRTIVEHHRGQLTASSDGKNGAVFQFVLPAKATDPNIGRA